jgi:hypothetical protein
MMDWSTDIAAAPRGKCVTIRKIGKDGKVHAQTIIEHEPVWLASKCGKVVKSHWLWSRKFGKYSTTAMTKPRWMMLGESEKPLAWRPFVEGEYPSHIPEGSKERVYPKGKSPEYPAMVLGF